MGIIHPPLSMDLFEPVKTPLILPDGSNPKGYLVPPDYMMDNLVRPHDLWETLVERISEKRQQRILVPELEYEDITSQMLGDIRLAYLGTTTGNTIYVRNQGRPDCKYLPPASGGVTNNELAREYLKYCLEEGQRTGGQILRCPKSHDRYLDILPTLYYEGGRHNGEYAYVDISSAYWTLCKTSTIDMRYEPGHHVLTGKAPFLDADEVTVYRQLRHAIPGNLKCGDMQVSRYGELSTCDFRSRLGYPSLVGYIMHTMHAIAREVIDHFGALMILTDAYIVPRDYASSLIDFLYERWGLQSIIKSEGEGSLYQLGVYQVGSKRSTNAPVRRTQAKEWDYRSESGTVIHHVCDSSPFSSLVDLDTFWLRQERRIILKQGLGGV